MHLRPARPHGGRPSHAVCGAASPIRVEWPTILLAASVYLIFGLLTWFYHALPWWLVLPLGGYLVGLHGSLQHEAIHGHPTNRPWLN